LCFGKNNARYFHKTEKKKKKGKGKGDGKREGGTGLKKMNRLGRGGGGG